MERVALRKILDGAFSRYQIDPVGALSSLIPRCPLGNTWTLHLGNFT